MIQKKGCRIAAKNPVKHPVQALCRICSIKPELLSNSVPAADSPYTFYRLQF
jgi:hypothetical protein